MEPIYFKKVRNVASPTGKRMEDSGIDFYIPEADMQFIEDFKAKNQEQLDEGMLQIYGEDGDVTIEILPQGRALIPSGIHVCIPPVQIERSHDILDLSSLVKISLDFDNKSGVASKKGLLVGADIVDYSYEGECHLSLFNASHKPVKLHPKDKIVQAIPRLVWNAPIEEFKGSLEEMYEDHISSRGKGGFGSTGEKA